MSSSPENIPLKPTLPKDTLSQETVSTLVAFFCKLDIDPNFHKLIKLENKRNFESALSDFILQHIVGSFMGFLNHGKLSPNNKAALLQLSSYSDTYLETCQGSYLLKTDSFVVNMWNEIMSFGFIRKYSCLVKWLKFLFDKLFGEVCPIVTDKNKDFMKRALTEPDSVRESLYLVVEEKLKTTFSTGFAVCCDECNEIYPCFLERKDIPSLERGEKKEEKKNEFLIDLGEFVIPCISETLVYYFEKMESGISQNNIQSVLEKFLLGNMNGFWHSYGKKDNNPMNEIVDKIFS